MPIRPENKARYPKNWKEIRARILKRAARGEKEWPCCEQCGVPNHVWIERDKDGVWSLIGAGDGTFVVLTIAHLNHTPEDCADENLKAWCQKCHNAYDAPMRAAGIKERNRAKRADGDLFK